MSKTAEIKLTLKSDGFKAGMADVEKNAKASGKSIGAALSNSLSSAGKEGLDALKGTLSSMKSAVMGFAGIAGGIGVVELARKAMATESSFRKLAFSIRAGTGEMVSWRDLQKEAQATALKFGHSTEEVAKSVSDLYAAVGDTKFAREASKTVAEVATGSHESIETITSLAGTLNEKFGITSEQLGDTLADVVSLGNKGGVSVEDLADKIGIIGANAKVAGLDGQKGFRLMVGMLNIADDATGNLKKGISGVSGIIEGISTGSLQDPLKKKMGFDLAKAKKDGLEFDDILGQIIEKSGGSHEKLADVFAGDQLKVVTQLAKVYQEAFDTTKGGTKEKTQAAWKAYDAAIAEAGKSSLKLADIQAEAAAEMETPEKKLATAMEKLAQAFTDPKVTDAFKQLASFIPKVMDQIIAHPLLTGALLSGVPQAITSSLLKSLTAGLGNVTGLGGGGVQAAALAAVTGGTLGYLEAKKENDAEQRRVDQNFGASLEGTSAHYNSRSVRAAKPELERMAKEYSQAAETQAAKLELARKVYVDSLGGSNANSMTFRAKGDTRTSPVITANELAYQQARKQLPGGTAEDLAQLTTELLKDARSIASADGELARLAQTVDDFQQASRNMQSKAEGTYGQLTSAAQQMGEAGYTNGQGRDAVGMKLHGMGDAEYGLGLGGPARKTHRQQRQEAEAAAREEREAEKTKAYAEANKSIVEALAKPLNVTVLNAAEIAGKKGEKGSDP